MEGLDLILRPPFNYELIKPVNPDPKRGVIQHYRIYDANDNRIATCYVLENAQYIVNALNYASEMKRLNDMEN